MKARLFGLLRKAKTKTLSRSFVVSLVSRPAQVGMAVLLARRFGPEGYGAFTFALGAALLGGRVGALGWPTLMMRFIPTYRAQENWAALRGLLRFGDGVVLLAGLIAGAALLALGYVLIPEHRLSLGLTLASVLLPVMAFRSLRRNQLAALDRPERGIAIDELVAPSVVMIAALTPWLVGPVEGVVVYALASLAAVALGSAMLRRHTPSATFDAPPQRNLRLWFAVALPALVGMSAKLFMNKTDVLMLAPLGTLEDVGYYGAALRVTYLQTAPMIVLSTVLTPWISGALASSRPQQAQRLFRYALGAAFLFATPVAAALIWLRAPVMTLLFGAEYLPGAPVLAVLALAQIAAALGVATTSYLLMSGQQMLFGKLTLAALAVNVLANFLLIPSYGALGAALATAGSTTALFLLQLAACMKPAPSPSAAVPDTVQGASHEFIR